MTGGAEEISAPEHLTREHDLAAFEAIPRVCPAAARAAIGGVAGETVEVRLGV